MHSFFRVLAFVSIVFVVNMQVASAEPLQSVLFVDAGVIGFEPLPLDLGDTITVYNLDAHKDGVQQIAQHLASHKNLASIHIVSHGHKGEVELGNSSLTRANIDLYRPELKSWGKALSDTGDILIYGCNVANGEAGADFVDRLATLTNADIAASNDLTGNKDKSGDWELEVTRGEIAESGMYLAQAKNQFSGVLPTVSFAGLGASDSGGSGYKALTDVNIVVSNTFEQDSVDEMFWNASVSSATMVIKADNTDAESFDVSELNVYGFGSGTPTFDETTTLVFRDKDNLIIRTMTLNADKSISSRNSGIPTDLFAFFDNNNTSPVTGVASITFNHVSFNSAIPINNSININFKDITYTNVVAPSVNSTPVISIDNGNLAYDENDTVTQVDSTAILLDVDGDADWIGGTLVAQITANNEAADALSIPDNIVGNINTLGTNIRDNITVIGTLSTSEGTVTNGTALTITFNASATNSLVQQVVRAIHYRNTSDDPGTSNRTITFTATDTNSASASDTRTVVFTAVNDEPTLTATGSNPTFTQGGGAATVFSSASVSTVEGGQTITAMTLTVTNVNDGSSEVLSFDGSNVQLTNGFNVASTVTNSLNVSVSVTGSTATITFSGATMSEAAAQSLVNGITYSNSAAPPNTSSRVFTITSLTDSGSNSSPSDNINSTLSVTSTVAVVAAPPSITSAVYNAGTGTLVATGVNFESAAGAVNDVDVSQLTFTGEGGNTYQLTATDVEIDSSTQFTVVLSSTDLTYVNGLLNKNGTNSDNSSTPYNLAAGDDFIRNVTAGNTADATTSITVGSVVVPTINSATYDVTSGVVSVTGTRFVNFVGASNDVDVSDFTFLGLGNGTRTIISSTDVEISSATSFSFTLSGADKTAVDALLNRNGLTASDTVTYNLSAAEDWMHGAAPSSTIADLTFNSITVNNVLDADGSVTAGSGVAEPITIATTVDTVGEALDIFDFTISDGGTSDADVLAVSEVRINTSGTIDPSKLTYRLNGPDTSNVSGSYSANVITFSGLSISVADSANETYTVNAYYNDNTGLTEGQTLILSVDGDTDLTVGAGSTQMGTTSAITNSTGSTVDVTATLMAFSTQPAGSVSGSALSTQPVVTARDAFGNTDNDFTETITLTEASAGSLSGGSIAAVSGVATFTSVNYTATADQQSFTLTADDQSGIGSDLSTVNANAVTADVVATELAFTTQPIPLSINSDEATSFTTVPVITARDGNGITDTGYSTAIILSEINGAGSALLSGTGDGDGSAATVTLSPSAGVATYTGLQITYSNTGGADENFNLQASAGAITSASSSQITSLAFDADGSVTAGSGVAEPIAIDTTVDTVGEALNIFDFTISDGGASDADVLTVSEVRINTSGTLDPSKLTYRLNGPDASNVSGSYSANAITFSGLSLSVADSANETYTVNAYYNDNTGLSEGQTLILSVDGDTDLTVGAGSTQMGTTSAITNSTGSTADVTATLMAFSTQPAGSVSGSALSTQPVVTARDAFGNTDSDFTETITLTEASAGSLSGGSIAAVSGVATFTSVNYTATADQQSFTLTADDQSGAGSDLPTVNSIAVTADVVATKLLFATQPAPTTVVSAQATNFTTVPAVKAVDVNDITDTGYSTGITLAEINGAGSALLSGTGDSDGSTATVTLTPSAGTATYTGLQITYTSSGSSNETFNLQASSGVLTTAASTAITATTLPSVNDTNISISGGSGSGGAYKIGDTIVATWNNTAGGDNNPGISAVSVNFSAFGGGTAVAASESSGTWTASYILTAGAIDASNLNVSVTVTNSSGPTTTADSSNATVDTIAPSLTADKLNISGASGLAGTFKIGDTITSAWNNSASGDNNSDTISNVSIDFSAFGGGSAVSASESSGTWTATYTIIAGAIDGTNLNTSVTVTDNAGNSTSTADNSNVMADNIAPVLSNGNISISGASGTGGAYQIGDTLTATWNNSATGDNNSDTLSSVSVDFSAFGGGAAVSATDNSGVWSATYTIAAGAIDSGNLNISVTTVDNAGNPTTTADTSNATVDNIPPVVTDANISISGASGTGGAYKLGDTITATWDNTASGDNNSDALSDVSVDFSAFGGGANVTATESSGTWTAAYTIDGSSISGSNLNIAVTATDNSGNSTTTSDTTNATSDNAPPSAHSVAFADTLIDSTDAANISFAFTNAEVASAYSYSITSSAGGASVTGSGTITTATDVISGINVSGLSDGTLSLSVVLTDTAGNVANPVTSTTTKDVRSAQSITFANPGQQDFGTTPTLNATASSNLSVTLSSTTPSVCEISASQLTFVSVGTCTVVANQSGDSTTWLAATAVTQSFAVAPVVPSAPIIGTAIKGDAQALVSFTEPDFTGGAAITQYTATANPGGLSKAGTSAPITFDGLTNGVEYTFTVTATNSVGDSDASSSSNAIIPSADASAPPIVLYDFENNSLDGSGNGNHGIINGSASYNTSGHTGSSLHFDGSAYLAMPNNLLVDNQDFSVAFWFKTATSGGLLGYQNNSVDNITSANEHVPILSVNARGNLHAELWTTNSGLVLTSTAAVNDDNWHYVVMTANTTENTLSVYLDREYVGTGSGNVQHLSMNFNQLGFNKGLGRTGLQDYDYFVGDIDEFTFYQSALPPSDLLDNQAPVANNQALSVIEDIAKAITLDVNDADDNALTYTIITAPSQGTLSGTAPDYTYTPDANFNGGDSFSFSANDGIVDSNTATVTITITPVDDAPVLTGTPIVEVNEDGSYSFAPAVSDQDTDTSTLIFSVANLPAWASFDSATGTITGVPDNSSVGDHQNIVISVSDGSSTTALPSFSIAVANTNDATIPTADSYTLDEGALLQTTVDTGVLDNDVDVDVDNDTLVAALVTSPSNSSNFTFNPDGSFSYRHNGSESRTDNFSYSVSDGTVTSDPVSVNLTIAAVNDLPSFITTAPTSVTQGSNVSYSVGVRDPDSVTELTLVEAPTWLSLVGNRLEGVAPFDTLENANVVIRVSDQEFSIDQNISLAILERGTPHVTIGTEWFGLPALVGETQQLSITLTHDHGPSLTAGTLDIVLQGAEFTATIDDAQCAPTASGYRCPVALTASASQNISLSIAPETQGNYVVSLELEETSSGTIVAQAITDVSATDTAVSQGNLQFTLANATALASIELDDQPGRELVAGTSIGGSVKLLDYDNALGTATVLGEINNQGQTNDVRVADIDGDGLDDVVVINSDGDASGVYYARGNLNFEQELSTQSLPYGRSAILYDLNDDGFKELIVGGKGFNLFIYQNQNGVFSSAPYIFNSVFEIVHFVIHKRKSSDAAFAGRMSIATRDAVVLMRFGLGANTQTKAGSVAQSEQSLITEEIDRITIEGISSLRSADLNGDGEEELIVSTAHQNNSAEQSGVTILSTGSETSLSTAARLGNASSKQVEIADFNGDGNLDLLVANTNDSFQFYYGNKTVESWQLKDTIIFNSSTLVLPEDVDNDGISDVLMYREDTDEVDIFLSANDGSLGIIADISITSNVSAISSSDFFWRYELIADNASAASVDNVVIRVTIPAGINIESMPALCEQTSAGVSCTLTNLPANSAEPLAFTMSSEQSPSNSPISATVDSNALDTSAENNSVITSLSETFPSVSVRVTGGGKKGGSVSWWLALIIAVWHLSCVGRIRSISRRVFTISAALCLLTFSSISHGEQNNWFTQLSVGQTRGHWDLPSFENNLDASTQEATITNVDNRRGSQELSLGYRVEPWLAVELGYRDWGDASFDLAGVSTDNASLLETIQSDYPASGKGVYAGLRFSYFESNDLELYTRLNGWAWSGDYSVTINDSAHTFKASSLDFILGVGVNVYFQSRYYLGVEFQAGSMEEQSQTNLGFVLGVTLE